MKYIKTYEENSKIDFPGSSLYNRYEIPPDNFKNNIQFNKTLIPEQMYKHEKNTICFIGNNGQGYPLLCLIFDFNKKYFSFIEWADWIKIEPLNINLKDYIIENKIVNRTIKSFEKHFFSSGPTGNSSKMVRELKNRLLSDEEIMLHKEVEEEIDKYNL